jgi:predicted nucleic acid-binding protein
VILVDSSVWIDYFRGMQSSQTDRLHALLGNEPIATGDLVLAEVLQGFVGAQDFNRGKKLLTSLPIIELVGEDIAIQAANNFRTLRSLASPSEKPSTH